MTPRKALDWCRRLSDAAWRRGTRRQDKATIAQASVSSTNGLAAAESSRAYLPVAKSVVKKQDGSSLKRGKKKKVVPPMTAGQAVANIPHVTESIAEYLRDDSCCSMWGQDLLAFMLTSKDCFVAAVPVAYRRYLVTNEFLPPLNFAKVTETGPRWRFYSRSVKSVVYVAGQEGSTVFEAPLDSILFLFPSATEIAVACNYHSRSCELPLGKMSIPGPISTGGIPCFSAGVHTAPRPFGVVVHSLTTAACEAVRVLGRRIFGRADLETSLANVTKLVLSASRSRQLLYRLTPNIKVLHVVEGFELDVTDLRRHCPHLEHFRLMPKVSRLLGSTLATMVCDTKLLQRLDQLVAKHPSLREVGFPITSWCIPTEMWWRPLPTARAAQQPRYPNLRKVSLEIDPLSRFTANQMASVLMQLFSPDCEITFDTGMLGHIYLLDNGEYCDNGGHKVDRMWASRHAEACNLALALRRKVERSRAVGF